MKHDPAKLKVWVNTVPGETWEERAEKIEPETLRDRANQETGERRKVPVGAGVLATSVDVQGDRLEVLTLAYGYAEESWLVDFTVLWGDPEQSAVWYDLDKYLAQPFEHVNGKLLYPERLVVDSGGQCTDEVYAYCKARLRRRLAAGWDLLTFPIKGGKEVGVPLVGTPSRKNRYRVPLFVLCVDAGKSTVISRLRIATAGPGYYHLPRWIDDEFLAQLTAEKALRVYERGRGWIRKWKKVRERNEALDLTVYALAALYMMGEGFIRSLPERAKDWAEPAGGEPPASSSAPPAAGRRRRGGGHMEQWRR